MNKRDIVWIENRIESLKKDKLKVVGLENVRRRHPAYKQVHGRILELRYIKKHLGGK